MIEQSPWTVANKASGSQLKKFGDRWDIHYRAAAQQIADEESARWGRKIAVTTLISNLTTGQGQYIREARQRLRNLIKETKENERHAHQNGPPQHHQGI